MKHRSYLLPATISAAFLAVAIFAIITYVNTIAIRNSEHIVTQAYDVREAAQQTLSAMKDAETGQRGYLLTGDPAFLEPHTAGVKKASQQLAHLKDLVSNEVDTRPHVLSLEDAFEQQIAHLSETIELRRAAPKLRISDDILDLVKSGRGKAAMESARASTNNILAIQEAKLNESEASAQELAYVSQTTITIGNLIALVLIAFVGLAAVIDRRKRDHAESELVKKQNELQTVIESAFEGIITFGQDLKIRYLNPAAAEILRVDTDPEKLLTSTVLDFMPKGNADVEPSGNVNFDPTSQCDQAFKNAIMFRGDGESILCEGTLTHQSLENDAFTTLKFRDISETEVLKARQREYALILNQVQEAIIICDLNDCIQSWNQGAEQLLGIAKSDAIGKDIATLLFPNRKNEWDAGRAPLLTSGSHTAEFSIMGKNGHELVIEKRRSIVYSDDNKPTAQLLFMLDVTDRIREEARERRSQRLESIGTLAGGVAHDLNNVLTPIIMSAKLLQRGSKSPERLLENIISSADRGARMIQKLLAFAGGEKSDRQQIDVREILSELEEILSHTLPPMIDLQVKVPEKLGSIAADNTELSQVIMNLAINARDAMPTGGQLVIEVEDFQIEPIHAARSDKLKAGPYVLLSVCDTGHGIPKTIIDRIFDPFFTTKAQGKGTGLGLATTIGIVHSYGGEISVYSEPGTGTKFSILLPSSEIKASPQQSNVPLEDISIGNGETILIVDDESMIIEAAAETLESHNYRVLTAAGGAEAIAKYQHQSANIDCVLLDMMMPGIDGFQVKDAMRAIKADSKIVASSGLRRPSHEGERLRDIQGFLAKPYSDQQLLQLIRNVLDNAN